jgi:hypothetical protein
MAAVNTLTPSIDSDVIHKLALQSDYVARYAELAEACRLAILRANAATAADAAPIQTVLENTIPRSADANVDPAADGTGAELTKNLIAKSLHAAVGGAVAAAAVPAAGGIGGAGGGAAGQGAQPPQAAPAAAADPAAVLAQFKSIIKDECSKALQIFRTFYNTNKTEIVNLRIGMDEAGVQAAAAAAAGANLFRVFRRPQTGGKRAKKSQKKSKKSRK